ncbi:MAG: histidine triad nucleotide-binding protein [Candidatus Obscuribacterales bacterium]|nr:histidine triad nucleotide-binding protein [Candidatus Obscuribacterales bacterium]
MEEKAGAKAGWGSHKDPSCLFCKIVAGEIPAQLVDEGDYHVAFRDINPQAPTHILVIPKSHRRDITQYDEPQQLGELFRAASTIAAKEGLTNGFRLVVNTGDDGGQTVHHLHVHVLGGRIMTWPPG